MDVINLFGFKINALIGLFILTIIITVFFTYFIKRILINAKIADNPIVSEHRHKTGTPTMGGIAFLFTILLIASIYFKNQYIFIPAILMVTAGIAGLIDDLIGLKVKEYQKLVKNVSNSPVNIGQLTLDVGCEARAATEKAKREVDGLIDDGKLKLVAEIPIKTEINEFEKIIIQLIIGIFLVVTGAITTLGGFSLGLLSIPVVLIAIVGAINSVNLIDGMDGLAAGIIAIASFASIIFMFLNGNIDNSYPFVILTGLCLGFLIFNKYPASIFMGDTGSFVLGAGYATAVLLCDVPYFGVLALAVPIVSVIVSLFHRANIIHLPTEPLHHTLNSIGFSEKKIIAIYWSLTAIVSIIGLLISYFIF
ncbi:MAG: glycosyltransferase family 4 protein [Methanobrevibacter sp.]|jgi:phospho-N-acetylmuramoyl-pentapeptide-transferase|nr:glycosyltransferase family 4 protein [Candidatus Methanoflexus mossambicus]